MKIIISESQLPKVFVKYIKTFYPYLIDGLKLDPMYEHEVYYATHQGEKFSVLIDRQYTVSPDGRRGYYINNIISPIVDMFGHKLFVEFFLEYYGIDIYPYTFVNIKAMAI